MTINQSVATTKATLSETINRVRRTGERVIIENRGHPIAAIVPLSDLPPEARIPADDWLNVLLRAGPEGEQLAGILDDVVAERGERPPRDLPLEAD
jgi:prevent-host-death family protein